MDRGLPTAVIIEIEKFGARKLADELLKKDIRVVGVGEEGVGLEGEKGWELRTEMPKDWGEFDYIFDLENRIDWGKEKIEDGQRIALLMVNERELAGRREMEGENVRVVEAYGVYGPGMEKNQDRSVDFLTKAMELAVMNQNLVLPTSERGYRLLGLGDWVEAVLRATFLRGTEGERFLVVGEEVGGEEIATVLIDRAKMTRVKVIQTDERVAEYAEGEIEETREKLRWVPERSFGEEAEETLQYFFSRIEEERRSSKSEAKKEKSEKRYEVAVEEKEEVEELKPEPVKEEVEEKIEEEMEEAEEIEEEKVVGKEIDFNQEQSSKFKIQNFRTLEKEPVVRDEEEEDEEEIETVEENYREVESEQLEVGRGGRGVRKRGGWWKWAVGGVVLGLLAIVPIRWVLIGVEGARAMGAAEKMVRSEKYEEARKLTEKAAGRIKSLDEEIDNWGLNRMGWARNLQTVLKVAEESLLLEGKVAELAEGSEKLKGAVFGEKEINWTGELEGVKRKVEELNSEMGVLEARLQGDWSFLPAKWRAWEQGKARELAEARRLVGLVSKGMEILPEFMGLDGKRREYLVLLQNEMELRPGGGFIGSYGILSFEGGRLVNFDVRDIYEADGQLKGHVEPPEELKKYLGEAGWFMRDANWQASFPAAVKDILWFLEKETGRKVDGVMGVDLAVARSILGVIGEIYIPDFKEKINKDNLYEQAEFYAENKFFPGSKQKASFLGGVGKYLFEEMKNLSAEKWWNLTKELMGKLEENEIQMVLSDKGAAKVVAGLGWDGAMYDGRCPSENGTSETRCVADYLYLVEANLGVNKANYFVYRKVEEMVEISGQTVSRVVRVTYENTAKNNNWPGGDYKNYMRVYLPAEVNLAEVAVGDGNKNENRRVYGDQELKVKVVNGRKEVGFLVMVPVGQRRVVEMRYSSSIKLGEKGNFSYLNYIQRQPGFGDTGMVVLVSFPSGWGPMQVQPGASMTGGKLLFNMKLDRDIKMGVELGR